MANVKGYAKAGIAAPVMAALEHRVRLDRVDKRPWRANVADWSYPRTTDTLPGDFIASNGSGAS
jgi:hypothetical protein